MLENQPDWLKYENYTVNILNDKILRKYISDCFKLSSFKVHPKAKLPGKTTSWEIDACGYDENGNLVLIECKYYSSARVAQNTLAAFAYIIKDTGAYRGIFVTTLGLQVGAKKVAEAEGIELIELAYNSTDENFYIRFSSCKEKGCGAVGLFTDNLPGASAIHGASISTQYDLE
jgi:predicted helicase